jgi:hypothetical protein
MKISEDIYAVPLDLLRARYKAPTLWRQIANHARSRLPPDMQDGHGARDALAPGAQHYYDVWMLGESLAPREVLACYLQTKQIDNRRRSLYDKRAAMRARLPLHVDAANMTAVAAVDPRIARILQDVERELLMLRKGPPRNEPPTVEEATNTRDAGRLRYRLKRYELLCGRAGGRYSTAPEAQQWWVLVQATTQHLRNCEQDLYEQRCREWEHDHKRDPVRFRKRPHKPLWLRQAEEREDAAATEARRCHINAVPLPTQTWHETEIARVHDVLEHRARVKEQRKRSHREALQCKACDWAWGVGRCSGLPLGDGWLYFDCNDVPYESLRQHVLASCAVRCTTGWAFPPCTAAGRVVGAGAAAGTGDV